MPKTHRTQTVLLLADGFDEAAVGLILARLRQQGLAVSLVGLRSKRVSGAHGLVIVPDMSLDRLLEIASPISALILPGGAGHLARLRVDPRVSSLLQRSIVEAAILVGLGGQVAQTVVELAESNGRSIEVIKPEAGAYLEDFACTLARQLVS